MSAPEDVLCEDTLVDSASLPVTIPAPPWATLAATGEPVTDDDLTPVVARTPLFPEAGTPLASLVGLRDDAYIRVYRALRTHRVPRECVTLELARTSYEVHYHARDAQHVAHVGDLAGAMQAIVDYYASSDAPRAPRTTPPPSSASAKPGWVF